MKKILIMASAAALALCLTGCSGTTAQTQTAPPAQNQSAAQTQESAAAPAENESTTQPAPAAGSPEAVIQSIQQDFANPQQKLLDEQTSLANAIGESFDNYVANVDSVQAWYDLAISESEALGERTVENVRQYYRAVVDTVDHGDSDALDAAMDDLYDLIYDDAFEEWYDVIYDDGFESMYDAYYDVAIENGYDTMPYDEWYDIKSAAYDSWYDAKSDVYDAWYDYKSDVYDEWLDVSSGFFNHEFDIDEILRLDK